MRGSMTAAMMLAGVLGGAGPAFAASDGRMGPMSSGSIAITVSVAPRAWSANDGSLCVSAPASGYSLRLADTSGTVPTLPKGDCPTGAQRNRLSPSLAAAGQTILIVAE